MTIEWVVTLRDGQKWTNGFRIKGDIKTKNEWKALGTLIGKDLSDSMIEVTCKKIKKEKV